MGLEFMIMANHVHHYASRKKNCGHKHYDITAAVRRQKEDVYLPCRFSSSTLSLKPLRDSKMALQLLKSLFHKTRVSNVRSTGAAETSFC